MLEVTRVLATTNEVSLKGGNRKWFENKITANVRRALADMPTATVQRPAWRVLIKFSEPVPFHEVARRLGTVFGLAKIMPVSHVGHTTQDLIEALPEHLDGLNPSNFAVRCLRSDKTFPKTSLELEREIGSAVQELSGWPVDLSRPELTIQVLVDQEGFHLWTRKIPGPGGLPSGSGGRGSCMLSGGIDSPVAAYLAMKRGLRLDFIHFHSVPRTDPASLEKTEELARLLARYQGKCRLAMIPLLPIQEKIIADCPPRFRVLLYRRFMLRLGDIFTRKFRSRALITGESLGQVASQTIENLAAVQTIVNLPILRPLISMDKQEIINLGRRIGTFEISIRPHFDCCSFLVPKHPATKATSIDLNEAEAGLDIEGLVRAAVQGSEVIRIDEPADWTEIPLLPELEEWK
ncbi:MAG: tRNA 4-thiouridine(8) synthase ThiI [Thermoanaerobaculales bacterium]|nr:tRNA 4-thiouridine(8) synthase ThiI [Thermoanaerobaculales bacterium]